MANRYFKQFTHTLEQGVVKLFGTMTVGAAGAISSSSCKGFDVVKTATETGRYTITLEDKYTSLLHCGVVVQGAADAAYTTACGLGHMLRGVAVSAATPVLYVQFVDREAVPADADLETGAVVYFEITLKNSSAF